MQPERGIVIVAHIGHGRTTSIARAIEAATQTNVEIVSPFEREPLEFKINSRNVLHEEYLIQKQFYESKPSKYIGKPRHNYRKK